MRPVVLALVLSACAVEAPVPQQPLPPPDVHDATAFHGEVIDAG